MPEAQKELSTLDRFLTPRIFLASPLFLYFVIMFFVSFMPWKLPQASAT